MPTHRDCTLKTHFPFSFAWMDGYGDTWSPVNYCNPIKQWHVSTHDIEIKINNDNSVFKGFDTMQSCWGLEWPMVQRFLRWIRSVNLSSVCAISSVSIVLWSNGLRSLVKDMATAERWIERQKLGWRSSVCSVADDAGRLLCKDLDLLEVYLFKMAGFQPRLLSKQRAIQPSALQVVSR